MAPVTDRNYVTNGVYVIGYINQFLIGWKCYPTEFSV